MTFKELGLRIDAENRLIYMIDGKSVAFLSFKDHY
ncbi:MAG: type II toxin-antitoxin system YoeB family toxin [Streptococcus salivarius]